MPRREPVDITIDNLSHEGRGIGRVGGKTVSVRGALPGERVTAHILRKRPQFDEAEVATVIVASPERIVPHCAHAEICGGCSMQHVGEAFQLRHKQAVLLELLRHHAGVTPRSVAAPAVGPQWGYRKKARLGVKLVPKKGGVLVGFRERAKPFIADIDRCEILDPRVGTRLLALRELVHGLSTPDRVPQIEVAASDEVVALIVRHLDPLTPADLSRLRAFSHAHDVDIYLQPAGPASVKRLQDGRVLKYAVGEFEFQFEPTDFTQINPVINERLVERVIDRMDLGKQERVLDLYCGLGNFSLPLAHRAGMLVGVEGESSMVDRARANAARNEVHNAQFVVADLDDPAALEVLRGGGFDKMVLDPPRVGAAAVVEAFDFDGLWRIVYVSCNPLTLARDAAMLIERHGFELVEAGILDMFPHTAHVESLCVFERS